MKRFTTNGNQSLKIIPREFFTEATISITNEFTKEEQSVLVSGNYFGGFWSTTFSFAADQKSTYKLIVTADGKVQWKGKAFGEQAFSKILFINDKALIFNNKGIVI